MHKQQLTRFQIPVRGPPGGGPSDPHAAPMLRGMASPNFRLEDLAYCKLILHALKYPHQTVNGVFIGFTDDASGLVIIEDAIPLQHHWTNLTPMMEVGLGMAANYAYSRQRHVVGYYQAPAGVDDKTLSPAGETVAARIKESFPTPIAIVLDGSKLDSANGEALVSYLPVSSTAFRSAKNKLRFNWAVAPRVLRHIHHNSILGRFWDFDDYLEDNRLPFLTNPEAPAALT